jgi:hypothetical protein
METLQLKVNGTYTDSVPINTLKRNQINAEIYGKEYLKEHSGYISMLASSIQNNGLDHPIETCSDKMTIIGGHHRLAALILLGIEIVPVVVTVITVKQLKNNPLETMQLLVRNNMQNDYSEYERMLQSDRYLEAFEAKHKRSPSKSEYEEEFGNFINFSWKKVKMAEKLRNGYNHDKEGFIPKREELILDMKSQKHSLNWCISTQLKDHKAKVDTILRPRYNIHDDLNITESVVESLKYAQKFVQDIKNYIVEIDGENVSLGAIQDDATLAGLLHGGVVKTLPTILGQKLDIKSEAPDMGAHFDVIAEEYQDKLGGHKWELEVKTTASDLGNWTTGSEKVGYTLFVASDKSFSRFFAAYVYVPGEYKDNGEDKRPWVGGGAIKTKKLSKNTLQKLIDLGYGKVLLGDIEIQDKTKKVEIFKDKLS